MLLKGIKNKLFSNWQEARRLRGLELFLQGWKQAEIAKAFGVTRAAVSQWIQRYEREGKNSLQALSRPGAPPRLSLEKKYQILEFLYPGAEAWGFVGDIWTNARIANVIERQFGVIYHRDHVAKIMKMLNWTSHKPVVKASQRNEKAIRNWVHHKWPAIKKSPKKGKNSFSPRRNRDLSAARNLQHLSIYPHGQSGSMAEQ